jgi:hypothetical protein
VCCNNTVMKPHTTSEGHILMEKRGARLLQQGMGIRETDWNIVELDARRKLRQRVNELVRHCNDTGLTTSEMRQQLLLGVKEFGSQLATQLVRSLQSDDQQKRQNVVWLLTLLNDTDSISLLQRMSQNKRLARPVRLSVSLALAGMGATAESTEQYQRIRLYAIG